MMGYIKRWGRWLALWLLLLALYGVDFWGLGLNPVLTGAPWALLGMAVIDTAVMALLLSRLQGAGWRLATAVFLLFFGLKTALVAVEAVYLPDVLPPEIVAPLLVNGLITAVLFSLAAVWLNGRWAAGEPITLAPWPFSVIGWIGRLAAAGFLWMVLFVAIGLLVFRPVAQALDADTAVAYLAAFQPENPLLILLFQMARGALWALLALPALALLPGATWQRGLLLGIVFAGWMSSGLLLPNDLLPATIWPAHLVEVVVENLLFGLALAWLFRARATLPANKPRLTIRPG
ncbi:MAG: hypothetical protein R6X34_12640 [Chloroflexota bacterium]